MSLLSDLPVSNTPVHDELQKALKNLQWKRARNLNLDDAWDWLESAATDVVDLFKPGGTDG